MGGKTTKLFRNSTQPGSNAQSENETPSYEQFNSHNHQQPDKTVVKTSTNPFVHYRRGSMYIDEDGDIAHEFYIETKEGSKVTLKQISNKYLTPQGDVPLDVPCIRNDYPVLLLDQSKLKE